MKNATLRAAVAALAIAIPATAHAQKVQGAAVVVIDTERVYRECTACVSAQSQIQGLVASAQTRAQQIGQPLQTEAQSIEQAAAAIRNQSGAARTSAETALNTRVQAFQQQQTSAQQELAGLERNIQSTQANVVRQINAGLNPIYTRVMNAHNANLALDVNATLAHSGALDVTNEVLASLNSALPSVSVTPLPAPPAGTQPAQPQPQPTR
jgi:Skp family chaperone for outer membrane proteins